MEDLLFDPNEFEILNEFEIPLEIEKQIQKGNYEDLYNYLFSIANDSSFEDQSRINAAFFAIKLNKTFHDKKIIAGSADLFQNDRDEDGLYLTHLSAEETASQKKAIKHLEELDVEALRVEIFNFCLTQFPDLKKGFDRSLYSSAKSKYWKSIGLIDQWEMPEKIRENIYEAESLAKESIEKNFKKLEEENWKKWAIEYQNWLKEKGLERVTKANLKEYFKEVKIKANNTTIDKIKQYLLKNE